MHLVLSIVGKGVMEIALAGQWFAHIRHWTHFLVSQIIGFSLNNDLMSCFVLDTWTDVGILNFSSGRFFIPTS